MTDDDQRAQIREWVKGRSPQELQALLAQITGGGLFEPELPHTPPMPPLPEPPEVTSALTVRVDVDDTSPPVWRRLVLHGDLALDEVHEIVQAAFGWQDYHLHKFWPGPEKKVWRGPSFLTEMDLEEGEEGVMETEVRLDQLLRQPGDRLFYTYDFGEDWTHTIKVESLDPLEPESPRAVCTGGRMAGPLEDSGGPRGYNELVKAYCSGGGLAGLEADQRDWVGPEWDPTAFDADAVNERLSLVGLTTDDLLAALAESDQAGGPAPWPEALDPLVDLAPPSVLAELAALVRRAWAEPEVEVSPEDLAAIARPYRYLVDLAGDEGIPLTGAGWMKPAYVERTYQELGLDSDWIGKGNREDQTLPVAELRRTAQEAGLLRKHKGRLLATKHARSLTSDQEYVAAVAARLLHHRNEHVRSAKALFALLTVTGGRAELDDADVVAQLMTACGLRTGPFGVERQHAGEWVWPMWFVLRHATGERVLDRGSGRAPHRAVALARAALWPQD